MKRSGSPQTPRVIEGQGFRQTSSPTSPGPTGSPSGPSTSIAMPSAGTPSVHSFNGITGLGERKQAPTSVPPDRLMIGQRPSPPTSNSQRYGSGFHGSPVEARIR